MSEIPLPPPEMFGFKGRLSVSAVTRSTKTPALGGGSNPHPMHGPLAAESPEHHIRQINRFHHFLVKDTFIRQTPSRSRLSLSLLSPSSPPSTTP